MPKVTDDRIPILLSQHTLSPVERRQTVGSHEMARWTLTLPAKWGMAFWLSLVHSETRIGGLRERSQQYFEAGAARFPQDYPGTNAFMEYEERRQAADQAYWDRRPPAKRPNYGKLGTPDPFLANFKSILDSWGRTRGKDIVTNNPGEGLDEREWIVSSSIVNLIIGESDRPPAFKGGDTQSILAIKLLDDWNDVAIARQGGRFYDVPSGLSSALVRVRVLPIGKGAPEELGMIYTLSYGGKLANTRAANFEALVGRMQDTRLGVVKKQVRSAEEGGEDLFEVSLHCYSLTY